MAVIILEPDIAQFVEVAAEIEYVTVNPELADTPADADVVTGRIGRFASAGAVMVWLAFCTVSVNDCITLPPALVAINVSG